MGNDDDRTTEPGEGMEWAGGPLSATDADTVPEAESQPYSARTREAQQAHGGSMAPGMVDPTGHPIYEPPQDEVLDEEAGSTDE